MFELTSEPIVPARVQHEGAGGFVSFEGKVRNHADGRAVLRLEYEAFPEMALTQGTNLVREAIDRFDLIDAQVQHRTGTLELGETAVLIQVAAAHRREAFAGCEWIIDQLKWRVPIWKRETYADGISEWVGTDTRPNPIEQDSARFARQQRLPQVGQEGQANIARAKVLLVGVGGLGSGSLPYLVAAGVGTIGIIDPDEVEITNLNRQVLYGTNEIGRSKVERAKAFAKKLNPSVQIDAYPGRLGADNVDRLVASYDWIIDGTDSLQVKYLLNAACKRHAKTLISASVHQFDGQLMVVSPTGPCMQCLFPEVPSEQSVGTCADDGILGVVPGILGVLQATEALKAILGLTPVFEDQLVLIDLLTMKTMQLKRTKRIDCPGCRGQFEPIISDLEVESLEEAQTRFGEFDLIDIRSEDETPKLTTAHRRLTTTEIREVAGGPRPLVICCASGARSYQLVANLRHQGFEQVVSLRGGLQGLHD